MAEEHPTPNTPLRPGAILALAAGALALRLLYLADASDYPAFDIPIVDALNYDENARALARGDAVGPGFFQQPVFYPYFLSIVYRLSGGSILAAKLVQALVGVATCLLTLWLGRRLFGRRAGLVAFAITALYGPLIFYETELLATGWAAFWAVTSVALCVVVRDRPSAWRCVALGLVGGLSVLTRPTFLPFAVAMAAWFGWSWLRDATARRTRWRCLPALVAGFAVAVLPSGIQTMNATGSFSILPASGGINLYVGNHPEMAEMLTIPVGEEWRQLSDTPKREGITGLWEQQSFFRDRVVELALEDPTGAAARLVQKTARLVSSREIPRNVDIYVAREWSAVLSALAWTIWRFGFPFGVLLPLAVVGAWSRRRDGLGVPVLFALLYGASIVVVFVTARYRIPLVPILAVFAGAGGVALYERAAARAWRTLAPWAATTAGVVLLATIPGPFAEEEQRFDAGLLANVAYYHYRQDDKPRAFELYRRALEVDPALAEAHLNVGNLLAEQRRFDEAQRHYEIARQEKPQLAAIHIALGSLQLQRNRVADAIASFRAAIEADPTLPQGPMNLAVALQRAGRNDDAIAAYREAVRLGPGNPLTHYNLGVALGQRRDHRGAIAAYREAVRLAPGDPRFRYGLGFALEQAGRPQEAAVEYEAVLRIAPGFADTQARLRGLRR